MGCLGKQVFYLYFLVTQKQWTWDVIRLHSWLCCPLQLYCQLAINILKNEDKSPRPHRGTYRQNNEVDREFPRCHSCWFTNHLGLAFILILFRTERKPEMRDNRAQQIKSMKCASTNSSTTVNLKLLTQANFLRRVQATHAILWILNWSAQLH